MSVQNCYSSSTRSAKLQSLQDVTGAEFKMFMDFLKSLSLFSEKAPPERVQELLEIVEGQADLDAQFNVSLLCVPFVEGSLSVCRDPLHPCFVLSAAPFCLSALTKERASKRSKDKQDFVSAFSASRSYLRFSFRMQSRNSML